MSIYPVNPIVTTKRPTTRSAPVPTPAQRCGTGLPLCNPGSCCSQWGYCGSTIDYCNAQSMYPMVPFPKPTTPAPTVLKIAPAAQACGTSLPLCPVGSCCSQWGFCGTTSDYCNSASVYQAVTTPRADGRCGLAFGNAGCASDQCCSPYGYCGSGSQYCSTAPPVPAAAQQSSIASLIPESVFDSLLSTSTTCEGHGVYTYSAFIQAASAFPLFGNQGTLQNRLTDIAGFLAHAVHESGSFCYVNELGYTTPATYCSQTPQWPCYPSANYHGRGPLQLSWNFNYIAFGQTLTSAQSVQLYQNPDMLSSSPDLLFRSALWFYMTPQSPKDSMHNVLIQSPPQFGQSISIINGGLECNGNNPAQAQDRITQFKRICQLLGCDPGPYLTC
ncbi:unnamed protein product (mitochondrion) [Plasmodiophora brassicae]|uniref:Chitin-binding type-1 domain-containing protein n=1 Tax=Plasmodiophora brassicae TaxID=37360 RepID=A0A3P3Y629_PLABS|nr:unnamed protein product [Plasmodiophora brassicae]